ncbi:HlyD family secretion protein [Rhizobium oryziradicis]|uniref:Uncharacterized protein n=1 Tax=Rhizobium oryziradicis TaxID=1867956 RepID=A0A1Q8ZXD4_9HYPH|nr:HlyD family secretion protein [Rhizobium oryziradicis]OLP46708.1 hypothetical protein BJF95_15395 [Rhizobium oryziradicis]
MTNTEQDISMVTSFDLPKPWRPPVHSLVTLVLITGLAMAGTLSVLAAWHLPPFETAIESTENASVRGKTTIISPQVSGYIHHITVQDYERVTAGQVLLKIDSSAYKQQLAQAQANLDISVANLANNTQLVAQRQADVATAGAKILSGKAELVKATADLVRANDLVTRGSFSVSALDAAKATEEAAKAAVTEAIAGNESAEQALRSAQVNARVLQAEVESAKAQLELAKINLDYTTVAAPESGRLSDIGARLGQYVTNGTQLMFLVPDEQWVIANYKEAQTDRIQPGQRAWFTVDALGGAKFTGKVEQLSPATGSEFSVLRTDNAIGNFTKIPQRISVKISIDPGQPLQQRLLPGMSVEANVDTASTLPQP